MRHWTGKQHFNCISILNMVKNLFLWPINGPFCILVSKLSVFLRTRLEQYSLSYPLLLIGHPCWNPCNTDHFSIDFETAPSTWRWRQLVPLNHQCHTPALHHATTVVYIIWMLSQSLTLHTHYLFIKSKDEWHSVQLSMLQIHVYKDTPRHTSKLSWSCTLNWITTSLHQSQQSPTISQTKGGLLWL
jgi:hypothetical protein